MKFDPVQVALASDEKYFSGLLVTAASIATFANKHKPVVINVVDGGISDSSFTFLKETLTKINPNVSCNRLIPSKTIFNKVPDYCGSKMTFLRILLPDLLAQESFVIYSDVDTLWCHDIAQLWDLRRNDAILQSVRELLPETLLAEREWSFSHSVNLNIETYFCAGICVFNLDRMRAENVFSRFMEFLSDHPDVKYADQTILNAILRPVKDYKLLPAEWQRYTYCINPIDFTKPFVLHYAGATPWATTHILTDAVMLWFRFDAKFRNQSIWKSIRTYHKPIWILFSRTFFLLSTSCGLPPLINRLLKAVGRGGVIKFWTLPVF